MGTEIAADHDTDVLVIGRGPGGLSAALYLARFRHAVLVVDLGTSRAAKIPRSHNYPGFPSALGTPLASVLLPSWMSTRDMRSRGRASTDWTIRA